MLEFLFYIKALVLGFTQGFTEFFPISSTAHLKVVSSIFGWGDPGVSFSASIQMGSVIACIYYFKCDIKYIIKEFFKSNKKLQNKNSLGFGILIGTLPIVFVGVKSLP